MSLRSFVWMVTFFFSYVPFIVYAWRWTDSIEVERAVFFWFLVTLVLGFVGIGISLDIEEKIQKLKKMEDKNGIDGKE